MPEWPKWLLPVLLILVAAVVVAVALAGRAWTTTSKSPRIHLVQDMDKQPKFQPQSANLLFADGRAMRLPVRGTVARGELNEDDAFHLGKRDGQWIQEFPKDVKLTFAFLERGQARFNIYCATCHGFSGYGNGPTHQRALPLMEGTWVPPLSMHHETVLKRPEGHLFNTITNGIRSMPAYGAQIAEGDRWAIVAYIRALQRSQKATLKDVPEDRRPALR